MKVAIIPDFCAENRQAYGQTVADCLRQYGGEVCVSQGDPEACIRGTELTIVLGGDGAMLRVAKLTAPLGKAMLGINCGHLGFMTGLEMDELALLSELPKGRFTVEERMMLSVQAEGAEELIYSTYRNSSGAMVGVSAVTALWSASRGIYGLLTGLNAVYGVSENRGYIYTRSISVVYTFVFILILLLTLVLHVFGNSIINLMRQVDNPVVIFFTDLIDLRFFLLLFLQSLVFTLMFMVLPNKRRSRFMESLPGGVLSSLGWLVFSDIYSIYVENFSKYSTIYGSVYGIAITMLWLYCCMSILFYGGALNRYLIDK